MTDTKPSMLEVHSQALEDVDQSYHEFLLIYRKNDRCVYGFVEGKDDPAFYSPLIERQLPEEWSIKLIPTGNKKKVLQSFTTFQNLKWRNYSKERFGFFIDRDLQDFLGYPQQVETNIYMTDGYSIENSVLKYQVLRSVLSNVYQISLLNPEEEEVIKQIIQKNKKAFFEAIIPLMGQIILWRKLDYKANLSNLRLDHLFSFSDSDANFESKERDVILQVAARQIGCDLCDDNDIKDAESEMLRHASWQMMVRGKYVLWFFVKQCEAIGKVIPNLLPRFRT